MVGGHDTNMAAAVRRFITNQPPLSTLQWPLKNPSVIQSQFSSALRGQEPFLYKLLSIITIISWVNFPFPASSLHLSSPCISWCSEYFLIAWVSAATQGPVVRGNTHHRFSISLSNHLLANIFSFVGETPLYKEQYWCVTLLREKKILKCNMLLDRVPTYDHFHNLTSGRCQWSSLSDGSILNFTVQWPLKRLDLFNSLSLHFPLCLNATLRKTQTRGRCTSLNCISSRPVKLLTIPPPQSGRTMSAQNPQTKFMKPHS